MNYHDHIQQCQSINYLKGIGRFVDATSDFTEKDRAIQQHWNLRGSAALNTFRKAQPKPVNYTLVWVVALLVAAVIFAIANGGIREVGR